MENFEKVAKLYNQISKDYEQIVKKTSNNFDQELVSFYGENHINEGTVLDLGCGNGRLGHLLGNNFDYTGIDYSNELLKLCPYKKKIHRDILMALKQFDDNSFDHTVALSSLFFIDQENFDKVLDQIMRVTRKSIFFTCEQFRNNFSKDYFNNTVEVYNNIPKRNEIICSELKLLWHTSKNQEPISGYICKGILK